MCGGVLAGGVAAGALCVCGPPARASQHPVGGARPGRHRRHRHVASSGADTVEDICTHVSCSVRVWRPAAARARRVTPWRDTCTPWCGPGRTSRCGKVEQRHVSPVTCHQSPVTCAGLWDGYDHYAGWGVAQSGATLGAGLLLLSATRTVRSAFGAPVPSLDIIYSLQLPCSRSG